MSGIIVTAVWLILNIKDLIEHYPFSLALFFYPFISKSSCLHYRKEFERGINQKKIIVFGVGNLGTLIDNSKSLEVVANFKHSIIQILWGDEINSVKILGGIDELTLISIKKTFAKF